MEVSPVPWQHHSLRGRLRRLVAEGHPRLHRWLCRRGVHSWKLERLWAHPRSSVCHPVSVCPCGAEHPEDLEIVAEMRGRHDEMWADLDSLTEERRTSGPLLVG